MPAVFYVGPSNGLFLARASYAIRYAQRETNSFVSHATGYFLERGRCRLACNLQTWIAYFLRYFSITCSLFMNEYADHWRYICGGTRPRNFPTASRHKALYLQSVRPTCLMVPSISLRFFRRIFGRMHTRQLSRTSNKRVRSANIEGKQRKESIWFRTKDSFCTELPSAKALAS